MQIQHENVPRRYDNTGLNESRPKQVNKNAITYDRQSGYGGAKPKSRSNSNKMALQVELEAKKRELEEIMGKHKGKSVVFRTQTKLSLPKLGLPI